MGIYLYTIRAKAHRVTLPNGEEVMAHEMKFLFNGGSFYSPNRLQKAMRAKAEAYWESRELPKYVILTGEEGAQDHDQVYLWTGGGPFWVDCDKFLGDKLGYLRKEGGRWLAGACQHEPRSEASIPPFDPDTGKDICVHCSMPFGSNDLARAAAYKEKMDKWAEEQLAEAARANEKARRYELEKKAIMEELARKVWTVEVEVGFQWMRGKLNFEQKMNAEEYARRVAAGRNWRVVEVS